MSERRRPVFAVPLVAVVVLSLGCSDFTREAPTRSMMPQRALASAAPAEDWDTYSADVTLTTSGGDLARAQEIGPRRIAYRRERTLTSDGTWQSSLTFTESWAPPQLADHRIARITVDEATGAMHLFDVTGREQPLLSRRDAPATLKLLPPADLWPTPVGRRTPRGGNASRDWADRIWLTADVREKERQSIERAFGGPTANANRQHVYRLARGQRMLELIRDPVTGLVFEHNVLSRGKRTAHTVYSYAEVAEGVFVQTGRHTEISPEDPRLRPLIVDETISNVRFTKRGGQP